MRCKLLKVRDTVAALRAALLLPSAESLEAQIPELHLAAQTLQHLQNEDLALESRGERVRALAELARDLRACSRLIA